MTQPEDISNVTIRNGVDLPSAVQQHEKQRFIYSNIRMLLTDVVEIKGLPDYVHEKKQVGFPTSIYFCIPSLIYVCLFGGKKSHWNSDALISKKCSLI